MRQRLGLRFGPFFFKEMAMAFEKEQMMTGEHDGGDMKIGGKTRKKVSATGKPTKKKKKHGKKSHKKHVAKKLL